ncbi:MAG: hypothetical protein HPY55_11450 [Firmicutes bacterium]|nr:hypothetical protein [Bacillota bacterium]
MEIQGVQGTTTQSTTAVTKSAQDLSGQFMKLLAAELKYQDPMSPLEDKDLMAQVAQLSTLDSINEMKESQERLMAASLVGRQVKVADGDSELEGLVWGVRLRDGIGLLIGDKEVSLDQVIEVR